MYYFYGRVNWGHITCLLYERTKSDQLVNYGDHARRKEIKELRSDITSCNQELQQMTRDYEQLKEQFKISQLHLRSTEQALKDVTNENVLLRKKKDVAEKKQQKVKQYLKKSAPECILTVLICLENEV